MMILCNRCLTEQPDDQFRKGHKVCRNCYCKDKVDFRRSIKIECLNYYSNGDIKCECCKERTIEFLCIDHIHNNGNQERRELNCPGGTRFYVILKKRNWPEGYRVLCHNCNASYGSFGYCPHKKENNLDIYLKEVISENKNEIS